MNRPLDTNLFLVWTFQNCTVAKDQINNFSLVKNEVLTNATVIVRNGVMLVLRELGGEAVESELFASVHDESWSVFRTGTSRCRM